MPGLGRRPTTAATAADGESAPPRRVRAINAALAAAWDAGWLPEPTLAPAALVDTAVRSTALADFGTDDGWRHRLTALTTALDREADLSPLGRVMAFGQLVGALRNRLRAQALWNRHPEILDRPIPAPVIVLGQMRSGTTRLHRLLACDPGFCHTRFYESWAPLPLCGAPPRWVDDRRWRGAAGLACARLLNPPFTRLHPTRSQAPDEEIGLHAVSLFGSVFEAQWRIPSFAALCESMDTLPIYREFRRLLQTIDWLRTPPGRQATPRPWILKVPQFTQDLPALLATFPDARLICTTRDPERVVASSVRLVHNQMALQSNRTDRDWIMREWRRKVALRTARIAASRALPAPRHDVTFAAMDQDWRREIRAIYAFLDRPLGADTLARMERYVGTATRTQMPRPEISTRISNLV
ncbi:MAG TPA: sulfotransferase [Sphingomonas sp.]